MILGIDTGMRTVGWSLLDERTCSFRDLGTVETEPMDEHVTIDRARRSSIGAKVIAEKAPGCSLIVVEQMSFPGGKPCRICKRRCGPKQVVPIALSWGVVLGIVAMLDPQPRLLTISPQRWQRMVQPNAGRKVDYGELSRAAAKFILTKHPRAAMSLLKIPNGLREHAIDASMIALAGALRPHACDEVSAAA
jgi:hypothetical protein